MGIKFTDEVQKQVDNGELVPLVVLFHRPATEKLVIFALGALPLAEVEALIHAYDFPTAGTIEDDE